MRRKICFLLVLCMILGLAAGCGRQKEEETITSLAQLNEEGRKIFFKAWQERKQEKMTHPFLKEKISWGLVPYTQALLLARSLRGDLDDYPPFLWK